MVSSIRDIETGGLVEVKIPTKDALLQTATLLETRVNELATLITTSKEALYWRKRTPDVSINEVRTRHTELRHAADLFRNECKEVTDIQTQGICLTRLLQVEARALRLERSIALMENKANNIYGSLQRALHVLEQVNNPKISVEAKLELVYSEFSSNNIDHLDSPRDIGKEFFKLFRKAIEDLTPQLPSKHPALSQESDLMLLQRDVEAKIGDYKLTPRHVKEFTPKEDISHEERQNLRDLANACTTVFSFRKMLGLAVRIKFCCRKELIGDKLENEHGRQIHHLSTRLDAAIIRVQQGTLSHKETLELSRSLDIYEDAFMRLKGSLKNKRRNIYAMPYDATFKAHLDLAWGLRCELSEVGHMIEIVRSLIQPNCLRAFAAQALLKEPESASNQKRLFSIIKQYDECKSVTHVLAEAVMSSVKSATRYLATEK